MSRPNAFATWCLLALVGVLVFFAQRIDELLRSQGELLAGMETAIEGQHSEFKSVREKLSKGRGAEWESVQEKLKKMETELSKIEMEIPTRRELNLIIDRLERKEGN